MEKTNNKRRKIDKSDAQEMTISNPDKSDLDKSDLDKSDPNWAKRLLETLIPLLKSVTGCKLYGPDSTNFGVREVVRLLEKYPCLHHHTYDYIEMVKGDLVNRSDRLYITGVSGESLLHTVANCLDVLYNKPDTCISTGARMNRTADNIFQSLLEHYQTTNHSQPPPPPPPPQNSPPPQDDEIKEACATLFLSIQHLTIKNVKKAYHRLALKYHPDKSKTKNKREVIEKANYILMKHLDKKKKK